MESNNDFLKDWLEGKVTTEELNSKKQQGDAFVQEFDELINRSKSLQVPEKITKQEAWKKLSAKLTETPAQETKVVAFNRWIPLSIAASISLVVIAFFVFNKVTVTTQFAENKVYTLPDGSEVTLNADSKIVVPRFMWFGERKVELQGEAFFNVTKGNTFVVKSEAGTVTVLGTSFNVNARTTGYEVSCFTGKVKVTSNQKEVLLTPGLLTRLENNTLIAPTAFDNKKSTWRNGDFYFEAKPLRTVITELERQFGVEIIFTGDDGRLYTGYFNNKNLDEALMMVFKPMSLNYQRDHNKVIVQ